MFSINEFKSSTLDAIAMDVETKSCLFFNFQSQPLNNKR